MGQRESQIAAAGNNGIQKPDRSIIRYSRSRGETTVELGRDAVGGTRFGNQAVHGRENSLLIVRLGRADVDAADGQVGHDVGGRAAVDGADVDRDAGGGFVECVKPLRQLRGGENGVAAVGEIAAGMRLGRG